MTKQENHTNSQWSGRLLCQSVCVHTAFLHVVMTGDRICSTTLCLASLVDILVCYTKSAATRCVQAEKILQSQTMKNVNKHTTCLSATLSLTACRYNRTILTVAVYAAADLQSAPLPPQQLMASRALTSTQV